MYPLLIFVNTKVVVNLKMLWIKVIAMCFIKQKKIFHHGIHCYMICQNCVY